MLNPQNLLKFAGSILSSDWVLMQKSIEEDCNKTDEDELKNDQTQDFFLSPLELKSL